MMDVKKETSSSMSCQETGNCTISESDILLLQLEISKYSQNSANKELMVEIQQKIGQLLQENKDCEMKMRLLEKKNISLILKFQKESDIMSHKYTVLKKEFNEQAKFLGTVRREVSHLWQVFREANAPYICKYPECGKTYTQKRSFAYHLATHEDNREFECEHEGCGKKFNHANLLRQHSTVHMTDTEGSVGKAGEEVQCTDTLLGCPGEGCSGGIRTSDEVKVMEYMEDGKKRYACMFEGCDVSYSRRSELKDHASTHTGELRYACSVDGCGKRYHRKQALRRHQASHAGESMFVCSYEGCDKRFKNGVALKRHVYIHTGEKPYACTFTGCGWSFIQKSTLKTHMLTHTGAKKA